MRVVLAGIDRTAHLGASFRSALQSLGHEVRVADPSRAYTFLDRRPFSRITREVKGDAPSGQKRFGRLLIRTCSDFQPDLVLAAGGCLTEEAMEEIRRESHALLVMYSTDNPFNPVVSRDFVRHSLPFWDAIATPRRETIPRLKAYCRGEVVYLPFGYDPDLHFPEEPGTEAEARRFRSDAVFLGGCDRDRVPFLNLLAEAPDLDVALYGGYYRQTPALRNRSKGLAYGREYRLALGGTSVALCLVRRANEDGHVMRTFEVPACGAFMLAERTPDHEEFFEEDREAVFFSSPEEMLDKTRFYARHDGVRLRVAEAGRQRVLRGANTYRDRVEFLVSTCMRHAAL